MTEAEIERTADDVLSRVFDHSGFESAKAEIRPNHVDEDSIFVTARFRGAAALARRAGTGDALVALRHAFREKGEDRLPHLIYQFSDDPPPYADDPYAAE